VDSNNKLARFNAPNSNVSQNFQDDDLWGYIANNQEINFGLNTRIQNHIDWILVLNQSIWPQFQKEPSHFYTLLFLKLKGKAFQLNLLCCQLLSLIIIHFHTLMERQRGYGNSFPLLERCMA